jgi:hypothetical protein
MHSIALVVGNNGDSQKDSREMLAWRNLSTSGIAHHTTALGVELLTFIRLPHRLAAPLKTANIAPKLGTVQ